MGDHPTAIEENRRRVSRMLGISERWITAKQLHGSGVHFAAGGTGSPDPPECDAIITDAPGSTIAVVAADCLPVCLLGRGCIAVVHVGWRGLCDGVIDNALERMRRVSSGGPIDAHLGPCIGPCHYQVGPEVGESFDVAYPSSPGFSRVEDGTLRFDLREAAAWVLGTWQVPVRSSDPSCTYCDERFFSFRRDGLTGRQGGIAWL